MFLIFENQVLKVITLLFLPKRHLSASYDTEGWYKRAPIVALRQAKFYPPRQAAVTQHLMYCSTAEHEILFISFNLRDHNKIHTYIHLSLVYCSGAAVGIDAQQFESFYTVPVTDLSCPHQLPEESHSVSVKLCGTKTVFYFIFVVK